MSLFGLGFRLHDLRFGFSGVSGSALLTACCTLLKPFRKCPPFRRMTSGSAFDEAWSDFTIIALIGTALIIATIVITVIYNLYKSYIILHNRNYSKGPCRYIQSVPIGPKYILFYVYGPFGKRSRFRAA